MDTTTRTLVLVLLVAAQCAAPVARAIELPADIHFNQCDSRWGDDQMGMPGGCELTICSGGTLVTCVAMLLSWVAGGADSPDPGLLNTWLQHHGGYVQCNLIYAIADDYDGDGTGLEWRASHSLSFDDWERLDAELAAGDRKPLVAVNYGWKWVVVYDRIGPSGVPSSYRVLDPGQPYSPEMTLAAYPSGDRTLFALAEFSGVFPTGSISGVADAGSPSATPAVRIAPNPFNPRTTIKYDLPGTGYVRLAVFDLAGRLVRTLVDESVPQGSHEAIWDGRDSSGREVGSGTYLARLEFGDRVEVVRMGLVR